MSTIVTFPHLEKLFGEDEHWFKRFDLIKSKYGRFEDIRIFWL